MPDAEQLARLQHKLQQELTELAEREALGDESAQTVELDQAKVGRLSRMDALQQQAMGIEQKRRRSLRIKQVRTALQRIKTEDYGWCLDCGEEIPSQRLEIDPAAAWCTGCADRH